MKQTLLRLPDKLHARLAAAARAHGTSMNALATEVLDQNLGDADRRGGAEVRARARALGALATDAGNTAGHRAAIDPQRWAAVRKGMRVGRPVMDDLWREGR